MNVFAIIVSAVVTLLSSFLLTKFLSWKLKTKGITGADVHKPDKPETAEMGGIGVLVSAVLGWIVFTVLDQGTSTLLVAALVTILYTGVVGLVDDLFSIRQRYKPIFVVIITLPVIVALINRTSVTVPIVGTIPLGLFFPLIIVPLAITTSANFSNMLAGFNGLEAGCAVIAIGTLAILSAITGSWEGTVLGLIFLSAYLGFLVLNWYPARIFPGDTGTLMAGAAIATIGLVSRLEFAAVVVSIPAALDFALKLITKRPFSARKIMGDTVVGTDGILRPPSYPALTHAFMIASPVSERGLVESVLGMECLYAALAIAMTVLLL